MVDFDGTSNAYQSGINQHGNISSRDLYASFKEYEDENYRGNFKTSKPDWDLELGRLRKNTPDAVIFTKKRGASGVMYRWIGEERGNPTPLRLVD
jgi:hypothetical protein